MCVMRRRRGGAQRRGTAVPWHGLTLNLKPFEGGRQGERQRRERHVPDEHPADVAAAHHDQRERERRGRYRQGREVSGDPQEPEEDDIVPEATADEEVEGKAEEAEGKAKDAKELEEVQQEEAAEEEHASRRRLLPCGSFR